MLIGDRESLRFRHDLARVCIEQSMPPERRRALHAQVFAALSRRADAAALLRDACIMPSRQVWSMRSSNWHLEPRATPRLPQRIATQPLCTAWRGMRKTCASGAG